MEFFVVLLVAVFIFLPIIVLFFSYNSLVSAKHEVENAANQVGVQLEHRERLIPQLLEAVKGSISYEKSMWQQWSEITGSSHTEKDLWGLVSKGDPTAKQIVDLISNIKTVPELRANQHISQLMDEIVSTENRLSFSKRYFFESVARLKKTAEKFPNVILAGIAGVPQEYTKTSLPAPPKPFEIEGVKTPRLEGEPDTKRLASQKRPALSQRKEEE